MPRARLVLALALLCTAAGARLSAQSPAPAVSPNPVPSPAEAPVHAEIRVLRDAARAAFDRKDFAALEKLLHPDVVFTWQNNVVGRKPAGVRAYYEKMTTGPEAVVADLKYDMQMDEVSIVHGGDAAIGFGKLNDSYTLKDGSVFKLDSRITVTSVKEGDRWVIAGVHGSANPFENGYLDAMVKKAAVTSGGGGALLGLILGLGLGWFVFGRK